LLILPVPETHRLQPEAAKSGLKRCHQRNASAADYGAGGKGETGTFKAGDERQEMEAVVEKRAKTFADGKGQKRELEGVCASS